MFLSLRKVVMNNRTIRMLTLGALLSVSLAALADTYTTIDFPGAVATDPSGINSSGVIVGAYTDTTGAAHGFQLYSGTLTVIDYPGATQTTPISIGARGDAAGFFLDPS